MKVFIVGGDGLIEKMYKSEGYEIVPNLDDADIVQFTGGADVDPSIYGDNRHPTTGSNLVRDKREQEIWEKVKSHKILKVGICRGSQFLCVMNGGKLYQDVDNHAIWGTHDVLYTDVDGKEHFSEVTSTHHQMMAPNWPVHTLAEVWGVAALTSYRDFGGEKKRRSDFDREGWDKEIVFWPLTNSLGFQGHPEYDSKECKDLFFTVLSRAAAIWEQNRSVDNVKIPTTVSSDYDDPEVEPQDDDDFDDD